MESKSVIKKEQAGLPENYSNENNLWVTNLLGEDRFLIRGGEARIYLDNDGTSVIKLDRSKNDSFQKGQAFFFTKKIATL